MVFIDRRNANGRVAEHGYADNDTIIGSRFNDALFGAEGNDSIRGGAGDDFISDQTRYWTGLPAVSAFLSERTPEDIDELEEFRAEGEESNRANNYYSGGNDKFFGEEGDDKIAGYGGHDLLDGGDGADIIWGGDGNDTLIGGADDGDDTLFGNDGDDDLRGGGGVDILRGGSGSDTLDGGAGDDILNGGTGADLLLGGAGADAIDGGDLAQSIFDSVVEQGLMSRDAADAAVAVLNAGDTAAYNVLRGPVDIDLERAVQRGGDAEGDVLVGIENVRGTRGGDTLRGDDNSNVLEGEFGSDTLEGRGGADTLNGDRAGGIGDAGRDTASYESSDAAVDVDFFRATQRGGDAQGDVLLSIENLEGSRFADQLRGDDGDNVFDPGLGNDFIDGRGGSDTIDLSAWDAGPLSPRPQVQVTLSEVGDGTATRAVFAGVLNGGFRIVETDTLRGIENVIGTNNRDNITGNGAANRLEGGAGPDTLLGAGGDDTLIGGSENDSIDGGQGVDSLFGDAGGDTITGGQGADVLFGGAGADVFQFLAPTEGGDTIVDFVSGVDKLFFEVDQFGAFLTFLSGNQPTANSFFQTLLYDTTTGVLSFDPDGFFSGAPIVIATLTSAPSLSQSDLIFG